MDKYQFLRLYKALVRPHLDFADIIYFPTTKKNKQIVENVQRRATRLVPGFKELDYETRLKELNLPTLQYRRDRGDLIFVFKILHNLVDIDYSLFFSKKSDGHEINTRGHSLKLHKPRASKNIRINAFSHRIIDNWNALLENIYSICKECDNF